MRDTTCGAAPLRCETGLAAWQADPHEGARFMKRLGLLPVTALGFVIACQSDRPARPPASPSADISDGAHAANCLTAANTCVLSNAHSFFLPPLVPAPTTSGVFTAPLAPTVMISQRG